MSEHMALYRKWRPKTFRDVIGQEPVTRTLRNEIVSGKTGHAFLFCGSRGTGKTTTARILSRALNCEHPVDGDPCNECETCRGILSGEIMDIVEIDAASNNGVDNIRDLRSDARFAAASARYKVYIIDEVHMLSSGAFNALLKLLEEPPEGIVFILATTETHKVPATILSRCQRFDFRRITSEDIKKRVAFVAAQEAIELTDGACALIAKSADGALRDALSLLDQCSALGKDVTEDAVYDLLGLTDKGFLYRVVRSVATDDTVRALELADEFVASGKSPAKLIESLTDYITTLLRFRVTGTVFYDTAASEEEEIRLVSGELTPERMMYCIDILTKTAASLKYMTGDRVMLDVAILKMCMPAYAEGEDAIALRLAELERKIEAGVVMRKESAPVSEASENPEEPEKPAKPAKPVRTAAMPTSEEIRTIEGQWKDICRSTKNIELLVALEHSSVREDEGKLILLYDDVDKIMLDILKKESVMEALSALIYDQTGLSPEIVPRLLSYYEGEKADEDDPLNKVSVPEIREPEPVAPIKAPANYEAPAESEEDTEEFLDEPEE